MARFNVVPFGEKSWKVVKNGRVVSKHRLKARAVQEARSKGMRGDTLTIHGKDGTILDTKTLRG